MSKRIALALSLMRLPILMFLLVLSFGFVSPVLAETSVSTEAAKQKVFFIGTNNHTLINAHSAEAFAVVIESVNLDGHKNLEQFLSKNLPQDIKAAELEANRRLETMDALEIQNAFSGMSIATRFDIKKAPAFVFDEGRAVIYGLTDARKALKRWAYYKSRSNSARNHDRVDF